MTQVAAIDADNTKAGVIDFASERSSADQSVDLSVT
jgi:hypothetical protein